MPTLTQAAPEVVYLNPPDELYESSPQLATNTSELPIYRPPRNPLDPSKLIYTRSWFGVGAGAAALGLLGLRRYGWPLAAAAGALGAASLAYMKYFEPAHPTLERITLPLASLPAALDGLRIGHITDTHLGLPNSSSNLAWAIEQMRRERPD